jgi:hypothetical protein
VFVLCWNTCVVEHGIGACLKTRSYCRSKSRSRVVSSPFSGISVHFWAKRTVQLHLEHSHSFHSKTFMFAQDTSITVRSRGIKHEYAFFKFLQSFILVLFRFVFFYFQVATLLDLHMLFAPRPVRSRKIRNR